ncbi:MAG: hypothetical protein QM775_13090 [Pirellulales bacterium]
MSCVFAVGYFHGIVRANFVSTYTTFLFDFAVLGMYLSLLLRPPPATQGSGKSKIVPWITALILWPLIVSAVPQNHILVQFVAFRATAWFLPMLWVGSRVTLADLRVVALTLALLNLVALAFGVAEYHYGVQAFYPLNAVTQIIYNSSDVAGGHLRIPSTFLNSHSYGGTMVCTLPFILGLLLKRVSDLEKALLFAGLVAAAGGIFLCASRQPVVVAALLLFIAWAITGFSPRIAVGLAVALVVLGVTTSGNERLLRFTNLTETSHVAMRIRGSVNESFLEYLASYPFGAGMGSSVGTSIPYFLADEAPSRSRSRKRVLPHPHRPGLDRTAPLAGLHLLAPSQTAHSTRRSLRRSRLRAHFNHLGHRLHRNRTPRFHSRQRYAPHAHGDYCRQETRKLPGIATTTRSQSRSMGDRHKN